MQFTKTDLEENRQVAEIIQFCDTADLNALEQIADQIYRYQPFLISIFLGYKDEVDVFQHDEIMRILIIIWRFFQDKKNVKRKQITVKKFEARQRKNVAFLKYLEREPSGQAQKQTTADNLGALKSKALFTAVLFKLKEGPALKKLDPELSGIILVGMKSLIESFEELSKPKRRRFARR